MDTIYIPKDTESKENARKFVGFVCPTQTGPKNCRGIWRSSSLLNVRGGLDPETVSDPYAYPTDGVYTKTKSFTCLSPEIRELYNSGWIRLLK